MSESRGVFSLIVAAFFNSLLAGVYLLHVTHCNSREALTDKVNAL